jgi:DNA-binding response OmpR family regulator
MSTKILVVDDDALVVDYAKALLEQQGYAVETAGDGAAATAWLKKNRADVVLIDILMPRKEGLETIIELKREHPGVVVLAMSASGARKGHDFLSIAAKFGADGILQKPFTPEQLVSLVQTRIGTPAVGAPISSLGV